MGWGVVQDGTAVPHRPTPAPIPSPQGGGEEFAALANRTLKPAVPDAAWMDPRVKSAVTSVVFREMN